MITAGRSEHFC